MGKFFFYGLIVATMAIFVIVSGKKQFNMRHVFLMISYSLYNLVFELIFGEILDMYYYIDKAHSLIYIIIASVFLYPLLAVLYIFFLPGKAKNIWYTAGSIILMLILELVSLQAGTIVLTGWRVIPWSVVTYIVSFYMLNIYNNFLLRVLPDT